MSWLPIAHAGHWAVNLLYVAPVVVTVVALIVVSRLGARAGVGRDGRR